MKGSDQGSVEVRPDGDLSLKVPEAGRDDSRRMEDNDDNLDVHQYQIRLNVVLAHLDLTSHGRVHVLLTHVFRTISIGGFKHVDHTFRD